MDFKQAVITCLRDKYADFNGRASRSEFWWFFLFQLIVTMILTAIHERLGNVASLAMLLPALGAGARRLHDIGKSGWFQLLWFVPIIGWLVLLYWAVQPSGEDNAYGPTPGTAAFPAIDDTPPGAV